MTGLRLRRFVPDGAMPPRSYGVAWHDWARDGRVCYPFGLHLLVRWGVDVYWALLRKRSRGWERELRRAREEGRKEGHERGWALGFREGLKEGQEIAHFLFLEALNRGAE